ncbi:divalent-cation tolerance protein CutA [Sphingomonas sp. ac-8]|uniref:divalent-cation tolerance protein CutA n=1 Tax=Sphingomonas sp. ac-8 TaxID=3242977 RepID=UPI003A7FA536
MTWIALVQAVFADTNEAERIGRAMVERRLAACVNVAAPCISIYRWQGAVEQTAEVPALFKTRLDLAERLAAAIAELHEYDLPAIEWWTAETSDAVAAWVADETR